MTVALLRRLGWPSGLVSVLNHVWGNQRRWIHFLSEVHSQPLVAPALPQGDAGGPLVMSLWITSGFRYVRSMAADPEAVFSRVYVDDRTLVSDSTVALAEHCRLWSEWSSGVGLVENRDKFAAIGRNVAFAELLKTEFTVADSADVLGVTIGRAQRLYSAKEQNRLLGCLKIIRLLACIRLTFNRFLSAVRMFAISKLSYGWMSRLFNRSDASQVWAAVSRASRRLRMASPFLRGALWGGNCHPDCVIAVRLLRVLSRLSHLNLLAWKLEPGYPLYVLHKWLIHRGWSLLRPFEWYSAFGNVTLSLENVEHVKLLQHQLRVGWRAWMLHQHSKLDRRDASACSFDPAVFESIQWDKTGSWSLSSPEARAISFGSSVSPAVYGVAAGGDSACI